MKKPPYFLTLSQDQQCVFMRVLAEFGYWTGNYSQRKASELYYAACQLFEQHGIEMFALEQAVEMNPRCFSKENQFENFICAVVRKQSELGLPELRYPELKTWVIEIDYLGNHGSITFVNTSLRKDTQAGDILDMTFPDKAFSEDLKGNKAKFFVAHYSMHLVYESIKEEAIRQWAAVLCRHTKFNHVDIP